jgi:hypothetical protein
LLKLSLYSKCFLKTGGATITAASFIHDNAMVMELRKGIEKACASNVALELESRVHRAGIVSNNVLSRLYNE